MKVTGFTFIRNAVKYDYPIVEAIRSILPLCQEVVVGLGNSEDDTETLIRSIETDKLKIVPSVWDDSLREGGTVLAVETDKALKQVSADTDWCFYIQADEIIHEQYYDAILQAMERYKDDPRVEGLLFRYKHFYGSYDYVGDTRRWYSHEIRIIRNDPSIYSYRDAQGFRKHGRKLNVKEIDAYVYHYGWVKHPGSQLQKILGFERLYNSGTMANRISVEAARQFDYSGIDSLTKFSGTHPAVMKDRIARKNWVFEHDITRKNFTVKGAVLHWVERVTGKRLFDYRNYRLLR